MGLGMRVYRGLGLRGLQGFRGLGFIGVWGSRGSNSNEPFFLSPPSALLQGREAHARAWVVQEHLV